MTVTTRNHEKKISLCLSNEGLQLFLAALLTEWGFTVSTSAPVDPQELLLIDESCSCCPDHHKRVNLISSAYIDTDHINQPIVLEHLWRVVEKHYHRPPRNHLRLGVDFPAEMEIRGQKYPGRLSSLSPAGARLLLPRELAVGEIFPIVLPLSQRSLNLLAKVIYINTFPDSDHHYDAGVIFERISAEDRTLLRDNIILTFFAGVRATLPRWAFEVGISHFDLSPSLRNQL